MGKKVKSEPVCPDIVRVELVTVPPGEVGYWILFDDATTELLARGICNKKAAEDAFIALQWKRDHERKVARELAELAS